MRTPTLAFLLALATLAPTATAAPMLWMTVRTEPGQASMQPTLLDPESPIPCIIGEGMRRETGWPTHEYTIARSDLDGPITRALAGAGLPPPNDDEAALVAVFYQWGLHQLPEEEISPELMARNILERARLAGGSAFTDELKVAMEESAKIAMTNRQGITSTGGPAAFSIAAGSSLNDPLANFPKRSRRHAFLLDQAGSDCFFLIITAAAHDAKTGRTGEILWRTTGTIRSRRLTPADAFPPLIAAMGSHFGKPTTESALLKQELQKPKR